MIAKWTSKKLTRAKPKKKKLTQWRRNSSWIFINSWSTSMEGTGAIKWHSNSSRKEKRRPKVKTELTLSPRQSNRSHLLCICYGIRDKMGWRFWMWLSYAVEKYQQGIVWLKKYSTQIWHTRCKGRHTKCTPRLCDVLVSNTKEKSPEEKAWETRRRFQETPLKRKLHQVCHGNQRKMLPNSLQQHWGDEWWRWC